MFIKRTSDEPYNIVLDEPYNIVLDELDNSLFYHMIEENRKLNI